MLGRGLRNRHSPHAALKKHPADQGDPSDRPQGPGQETHVAGRVLEHDITQPSSEYPVLLQGDKRARLELLSSFPDFGFVKVFKDGSGTLHDRNGGEIVGFFDVKDLQRISESHLEALARYANRSERNRVLKYSIRHDDEQEACHAFGPVRPGSAGGKRKKMKAAFPMVSHGEAEADLRLLAYFDTFTSVNLNPDGSGTVRSFTEAVVERFDDVASLHAILATRAMKERLQGAGKV